MPTAEKRLGVQEEVILALYMMLYKEPYHCAGRPRPHDEVNMIHVNAQKAIFIFSEMMVPAGDYGFCWNHQGPYSEQLQIQLRALDGKPKLVQEYCDEFAKNPDEKLEVLFTRGQILKIKNVAVGMSEVAKGEMGGELLGSLLYISRTVMPGSGFDRVNSELQLRKTSFPDQKVNRKAWDALEKLDLVPVCG